MLNPISLLGPSNTNQGLPSNPNPEREARRVLDSYSGRLHYTENESTLIPESIDEGRIFSPWFSRYQAKGL